MNNSIAQDLHQLQVALKTLRDGGVLLGITPDATGDEGSLVGDFAVEIAAEFRRTDKVIEAVRSITRLIFSESDSIGLFSERLLEWLQTSPQLAHTVLFAMTIAKLWLKFREVDERIDYLQDRL